MTLGLCFVHQAEILSRITCGKEGWTGFEEVTRKMPDISEWLDFDFYDSVWWLNKNNPLTTDDEIILGI